MRSTVPVRFHSVAFLNRLTFDRDIMRVLLNFSSVLKGGQSITAVLFACDRKQ